MKIVVDSMPDSPSECLFCIDVYNDICQFDKETCVYSSYYDTSLNSLYGNSVYCPYLIEVQVKEGSIFK